MDRTQLATLPRQLPTHTLSGRQQLRSQRAQALLCSRGATLKDSPKDQLAAATAQAAPAARVVVSAALAARVALAVRAASSVAAQAVLRAAPVASLADVVVALAVLQADAAVAAARGDCRKSVGTERQKSPWLTPHASNASENPPRSRPSPAADHRRASQKWERQLDGFRDWWQKRVPNVHGPP